MAAASGVHPTPPGRRRAGTIPAGRPAPGPRAGTADAVLLGLTAVAGGGLALQARLNGELGVRLGSPLAAGAVNFLTGLGVVTLAVAVRRVPLRRVLHPATRRWWHWTGGLCAVVFVCSVVVATPRLGVSLVSVAVAGGMATAGLLADAIGLGPAGRQPPGLARVAGAAIAVAAVMVSSSGAARGAGQAPYVVVAVAGGFAVGCQQPLNARLSRAVGDTGLAAVASFAVGSVASVAVASTAGPVHPWPSDPALYAGGALAAAYVLVATPAVGRLGALRVSLTTITGQMVAAALLDVVAPIGDHRLTAWNLAGVLLAIGAIVLTARPQAGPGGRRRTRAPSSARMRTG
ncbi:MAG TPA: DMT family transporter [Acidimicrobiales bacterium]|nr:DMT family transporter [Acidimicrobiales bacterium]